MPCAPANGEKHGCISAVMGIFTNKSRGKPAETAERLCKAGALRLRRVNGVIRADYTAPNGSRSTLLLGLRAAGGVS